MEKFLVLSGTKEIPLPNSIHGLVTVEFKSGNEETSRYLLKQNVLLAEVR